MLMTNIHSVCATGKSSAKHRKERRELRSTNGDAAVAVGLDFEGFYLVGVHVQQALVDRYRFPLFGDQLLLEPVSRRHLHLLLGIKYVLILTTQKNNRLQSDVPSSNCLFCSGFDNAWN